jgi:membrane protein required for colicin V production
MSLLPDFNWIDFTILAIATGSFLLGLIRGMVREVFSLAGWVVSFILAREFGPLVSGWLPASLSGPVARLVVASVLVFFIGMVAMALISHLISSAVEKIGIESLNRILGGVFGLVRAYLLLVLVLILAGFTPLVTSPDWHGAWFHGPITRGAQWCVGWLPESVAKEISVK